jgi:hypothetical protein
MKGLQRNNRETDLFILAGTQPKKETLAFFIEIHPLLGQQKGFSGKCLPNPRVIISFQKGKQFQTDPIPNVAGLLVAGVFPEDNFSFLKILYNLAM